MASRILLPFAVAALASAAQAQTQITNKLADSSALRSTTPEVFVQDHLAASVSVREATSGWQVIARVSEDGGSTWGSEVRVDSDATGRPKRVVSHGVWVIGDAIYTAWEDDRAGVGRSSTDLYFARSTDRGATWEPEVRIDKGFEPGGHPIRSSLLLASAAGPSAHTVQLLFTVRGEEGRDGLFLVASTDGGATFQPPLAVDSGGADVDEFDAVLTVGMKLLVAWQDDRDGLNRVYRRRNVPGVLTWEAPEEPIGTGLFEAVQQVAVSRRADRVLVAWMEESAGRTQEQLYVSTSADGGATFAAPQQVGGYDEMQDDVDAPACAVSPSRFLVAWTDDRSDQEEVYVASSTDGSVWTETPLSPTSDSGGRLPVFARSSDQDSGAFLVWTTYAYPNVVEMSYSDDDGASWGAVAQISSEGPLGHDVDSAVAGVDRITGSLLVSYLGEADLSAPDQVSDDLWQTKLYLP